MKVETGFDKALRDLMRTYTGAEILDIPGIREVLSVYFEDLVIEVMGDTMDQEERS